MITILPAIVKYFSGKISLHLLPGEHFLVLPRLRPANGCSMCADGRFYPPVIFQRAETRRASVANTDEIAIRNPAERIQAARTRSTSKKYRTFFEAVVGQGG